MTFTIIVVKRTKYRVQAASAAEAQALALRAILGMGMDGRVAAEAGHTVTLETPEIVDTTPSRAVD